MAGSEETEDVMDLDTVENEKRAHDDHDSERAVDESWSDYIRSKIAQYTSPLVERYEGRANVELNENEDFNESFVGSMNQKPSGRTSPGTEPSDATDANDSADADDGIIQKIANLASPITDFIQEYTEKDVTEPPKENFLQKIAGRFDKNVKFQNLESTWNDKVVNTITRVSLPLTDRFETLEILNGFDIHEMPRNQVLAGVGGLVLLLLFSIKCCVTKRKQPPPNRRPRSPTHDGARARARSGSFDVFLRRNNMTRDRTGTADDPLDAALKASNIDAPLVVGAGVPCISYETWSPPMQWSEASRMLLPVNTKPEHQRNLTLNFQTGTLTREDKGGGKAETFDMKDVSLHVKTPVSGGVLQLYIKGTPEEQWLEHTFASAHQAAQFQQDLINFQVVGPVITNMYESLELIQKGSLGHDGKECVLHDDTSDTKKALVAWDDCMRCFCGITVLRKALDTDLVHRILDTTDGEETSVPEEYVGSRLLLGRFHFFRLFVPYVDPTGLPELESSPERVTELLERRKRVARAAMLVEGYVQARTVANKGWNLSIDLPEEAFTKRLAFDEDIDNVKRDSQAKNEYYEATVSRDVRCEVHSSKQLEKPGSSVLSKYQAFSLVASQVFELPPKGERRPLSHRKDPVLALPSLQKMVESYPKLDFFVCSFFPAGLGVAVVHVFVRSLPKGVDSSFDTIMDRFMNGTVEVRQRKLECFIQLGPGARLSPLAWGALKTVSMLLSWSRRGEAQIPYDSGSDGDRTPFPGMRVSNYMEVSHFGGSLQTDTNLPKNYVSVTAHVDPSKMNPAMRVLYQRLEEGGLQACTVDFTFVLEGEQVDELPERALGSIRIVHLDVTKIALPTHYSASQGPVEDDDSVPEETQRSSLSPLTKTMSVIWNSLASGSSGALGEREQPPHEMPQTPTNGRGRDPFQMGIDALHDVLRGVTVPVRRETLSSDDPTLLSENDCAFTQDAVTETGDLVNVPVLSITSTNDLRRYFRATGCDLKETSVRVVESAAWRGVTLPIDTRLCRVELQSGQFFQQGRDVDGDPVFYFQNMLMGPWRRNMNASVAAILYRLESSLNELADEDPDVRCTVIALVGKPFKRISRKKKRRKGEGNDDSSAVSESKDASDDGEEETSSEAASVASHTVDQSTWNPLRRGANPRLYPEEDYHVHSNILMFQRLAELLDAHYPERLKRLILVPGQGRSITYMNTTFAIRKIITCSRIRNKVIHLNRASELPKYVEDDELCTIVGGNVQVLEENAFEC